MPLERIGFNVSHLSNVSTPDLNISNNIDTFIEQIPQKANEYTSGYIGGIILSAVFGYLFYLLNDTGQDGVFRYSTLRALCLSSGIASVCGIMLLAVSYYTGIYLLIIFLTVFMVSFILIFIDEI